jgi:SAM-dependent methyltransferases related to tRNA (uracil-5-)-methyltransferase
MTTLELAITNVAHGGVFVARHEGRVVFVADTMPGERVLARVTDDAHDSFWRAETVEVLDASPHRVPHVWAAASIDRDPSERAGGAEFGHIALPYQRELKRQVIADAMERMAGSTVPVEVEAASGDDATGGTGWRTRVRLHVDAEGVVGPYALRSHRVIQVSDLPLATAEVAAAAPLGTAMPAGGSVDVVAPSTGPARVLVADAPAPRSDSDARTGARGRTGAPGRTGARGRTGGPGARSSATRYRDRAGSEALVERVGDREFTVDAGGFWQVHREAPGILTAAVQGAIDEAQFDPRAANLDLYGGVGLLAAAVGDRFGSTTRITTVEADARATDHAASNLADWVGASALTERVDRHLGFLVTGASAAERARLRAGTVVLDPPRSGAGNVVVGALTEIGPAQIVYVACDPIAFARDAALFAAGGYTVRAVRAFDLFPNTHHVELVASIVPAG